MLAISGRVVTPQEEPLADVRVLPPHPLQHPPVTNEAGAHIVMPRVDERSSRYQHG